MNESEAPYQAAETFRVSLLTSQTLSWCIYDLNVTPLKHDTEKYTHFLFPTFVSRQIIPYFGLLFTCFEMCKQVCLYRNGYIVSPLSYKLAPGVDQSLGPYELQEVKRYLKNRNFGTRESSLGNRW